jgi:hypothetical protein
MSVEDYKPRFLFEITQEQKDRADRLISQYGLRKAIFGPILDDVLDLIEEYGGVAIGVIMSGKLKPRQVIPSMQKADEIGSKNV